MSLWTDIAVTSGSGSAALAVTGAAIYKVIRHFLHGAVDAQLDKKLDDKLAPIVAGMKERFDANDKATETAVQAIAEVRSEQQDVAIKLATQFGGNGNGIRQAINELSVTIGTVKGAFEQHIQETKEAK